MDIGKFIANVREMRKAQREYFKWRSAGWLDRAKTAEKKVDAQLDEYYNQRAIQKGFDF